MELGTGTVAGVAPGCGEHVVGPVHGRDPIALAGERDGDSPLSAPEVEDAAPGRPRQGRAEELEVLGGVELLVGAGHHVPVARAEEHGAPLIPTRGRGATAVKNRRASRGYTALRPRPEEDHEHAERYPGRIIQRARESGSARDRST